MKKADLDKEEYLKRLALHHDVMVAAMKTKQSSELAAVDTLDQAIEVGFERPLKSSERHWLRSTSEGRDFKSLPCAFQS